MTLDPGFPAIKDRKQEVKINKLQSIIGMIISHYPGRWSTKCPHCQKGIRVNAVAKLAEKKTLKVAYTMESITDIISAKVLGDSINSMQKLLKEIGKELGGGK